MVRVHMSVTQYKLLCKYDSLLAVRVDKLNRYYILFLFFYKDSFVSKLLNKLMIAGNKYKALFVFRTALSLLKKSIGFQPFFFFKHIVFRMRQIFKVNTVKIIEQNRIIYWPVFLHAYKQIAYSVNHVVVSAFQLHKEEDLPMGYALHIVFLNCFFKSRLSNV